MELAAADGAVARYYQTVCESVGLPLTWLDDVCGVPVDRPVPLLDPNCPRLTVHDELDFSDPGGRDAAFEEMRRVMETAIPGLRVPIRADCDAGPNWGDVEKLTTTA